MINGLFANKRKLLDRISELQDENARLRDDLRKTETLNHNLASELLLYRRKAARKQRGGKPSTTRRDED